MVTGAAIVEGSPKRQIGKASPVKPEGLREPDANAADDAIYLSHPGRSYGRAYETDAGVCLITTLSWPCIGITALERPDCSNWWLYRAHIAQGWDSCLRGCARTGGSSGRHYAAIEPLHHAGWFSLSWAWSAGVLCQLLAQLVELMV